VLAAALAALAGWAVAGSTLPASDTWADHPPGVGRVVGSGMLAGIAVSAGFGAVAWTLDRRDIRPMAAAVARRLSRTGRLSRSRRPSRRGADGRDEKGRG
jgi:putative peptidoglycan lipid II flippase